MRKAATTVLVLALSGLGAIAAATPKPADQPRTMEEVIDRVITNENRANQQIRQYSPLVETYIQNLKPDKELGRVPAGDKYFLGRADFSKGVQLVSLSDAQGKGDERSEEHTSELQSLAYLVCRLLLEKKKKTQQKSRV